MYRYDVIVVGCGPGGALAAYELAQGGVETLVIEKSLFPRYKPCGGGITLKVDRVLPFSIHEVVEKVIRGARLTSGGRGETTLMSDRPVAYMVMRDRFDHFLAEKARGAGARIIEGQAVVSVHPDEDPGDGGYRVTTSSETFLCRYLVGADGAHSQVRRSLFPQWKRTLSPAMEWEIPMEAEWMASIDDRISVDFGHVPHGYAWVFPKSCRLSVGIGGLSGGLAHPRELLMEYVRQQPVLRGVREERSRPIGYPIPVFSGEVPLTSGRALLVGDAGNLVDPFFGEGIVYAMQSGRIAAEVLLKNMKDGTPSLASYDLCMADQIYPEFHAARKIARWVYAWPRFFCRLVRDNPDLAERYFEALRGNGGYPRFWNDLKRLAPRVLAQSALRSLRGMGGFS
jgi:geranylgeranyl reductase family protein